MTGKGSKEYNFYDSEVSQVRLKRPGPKQFPRSRCRSIARSKSRSTQGQRGQLWHGMLLALVKETVHSLLQCTASALH